MSQKRIRSKQQDIQNAILSQVVFYSDSATRHTNYFITYRLYIRIIVQLQVEQLQIDARTMLQPFVAHWLAHVRTPANVRVKIDVNPQNFM